MKKSILLFGFSITIVCGFSQSDVSGPFLGHQRTAGRFCGWSPGFGSVAGSFDIRNDFAGQPINFFTGGSTPAFQRMTIRGSGGPTAGFIGMGNGFSTPLSLLHLNGFGNTTGNLFRTDGDQAVRNQWQMFNGTSATTTNEIGVLFTDPTTSSQLFAGQQHRDNKITV